MSKTANISWLLGSFCLMSFLIGCNNIKDKNIPSKIIFDTDIGNDIDDVLALQMLVNYHNSNSINLLGVTISKSNPYAIEYVDGFFRFHEIENMPIGFIYEGPNSNDGKYLKQTLDTLIEGSPILLPKVTARDYLPDAWELQRKLLSQQEDSSVVMVAVGPLTNLRRLLESTKDQHSELNGIDLVSKKVRLLSVMGGEFSDSLDFTEWNIAQDIESAYIVFEYWPTQIVASGWEVGNKLLFPHQRILNDFNNAKKHPLVISYKLWGKMPYDRPSWDLTSVLYAIETDKNYFNLSQNGNVIINNEGNSIFVADKDGKHRFLIIDQSKIQYTLNALIDKVTKEGKKNIEK